LRGGEYLEAAKDKHKKEIICPTKTCEDITVTVPVEVQAHAFVGDIVLKCKEHQIIKRHEKLQHVSKFEVMHKMFVQLPIDFVTKIEVADSRVDFDVYECKQ